MTLTWLATTDRSSRLDFIKSCILECNLEETERVFSMAVTAKKRRKRDIEVSSLASKTKLVAPATTAVAPANTLVAPATTAVAPANTSVSQRRPWWQMYNKKDIIALDCEMISLHECNEHGKHITRAATVSIVNFKDEIVYQVS